MKFVRYAVIPLLILASPVWAQSPPPQPADKNPPPKMRYANMPPWAEPYGRFRKPYFEWFLKPDTLAYYGAARSEPDGNLKELKTVNIGFLGPLDRTNPLSAYGIPMLHGAELAVELANAHGGYQGKPFALKVHDDLPLWGASAMEIVKMRYQDHDWGMLGSVNSASTHIALRATLKVEVPMVDTATNDPTVTETRIQWLLHNFPDDRQMGYALDDYLFKQLKLKKVGLMRSTSRYGRLGDEIFLDVSRRISQQPLVEAKFEPNQTDFSTQLKMLRHIGIDGLVIWGNAPQAAAILKQMRAMGMKQPVFGSSRTAYPELIREAGFASDGFVAVCPMNPTRHDPAWKAFQKQFFQRFHEEPDPYAAFAYDGMNMLIGAIRKAGLNRGRIMDALRAYAMKRYQGVTGTAFFDYTLNNIAPVWFCRVKDGHFEYWPEQRTDWKDQSVAFMK